MNPLNYMRLHDYSSRNSRQHWINASNGKIRPVGVWMSDKQDAFVQAIGTEFPHTPHRYCQNHFLRDLAKPVLELDSQAKVKMRSKVRGLRTIERRVLEERRRTAALEPSPPPGPPQADETPPVAISEAAAPEAWARHA